MSHDDLDEPLIQGSEDLLKVYVVDVYLDASTKERIEVPVNLDGVTTLELHVWTRGSSAAAWTKIIHPSHPFDLTKSSQVTDTGEAYVYLPSDLWVGEDAEGEAYSIEGDVKLRLKWTSTSGRVNWSDPKYGRVVAP